MVAVASGTNLTFYGFYSFTVLLCTYLLRCNITPVLACWWIFVLFTTQNLRMYWYGWSEGKVCFVFLQSSAKPNQKQFPIHPMLPAWCIIPKNWILARFTTLVSLNSTPPHRCDAVRTPFFRSTKGREDNFVTRQNLCFCWLIPSFAANLKELDPNKHRFSINRSSVYLWPWVNGPWGQRSPLRWCSVTPVRWILVKPWQLVWKLTI